MLGPEEREDGELEVVRLAAEQLPDSVELPVGEAEGAMERLFCDPRQRIESSDGAWMSLVCPTGHAAGSGRGPPSEFDPIAEIRACL